MQALTMVNDEISDKAYIGENSYLLNFLINKILIGVQSLVGLTIPVEFGFM